MPPFTLAEPPFSPNQPPPSPITPQRNLPPTITLSLSDIATFRTAHMAETMQERQNHQDVIERLRERNKGLQDVIKRLKNEKRTLENAMDDMETERDDALDKVMEREEDLGVLHDYATELEYEREDDKREIGELRRLLRDARALVVPPNPAPAPRRNARRASPDPAPAARRNTRRAVPNPARTDVKKPAPRAPRAADRPPQRRCAVGVSYAV